MSDTEHSEKSGGHGGGHRPHGGGHEEGHEGAPEWLISFADNVMLQMGFFVILLALNLKEPTTGGVGGKDGEGSPPATILDAAIAIREAFNNPVDLSSTDPNDFALVQRILERKRNGQTSQPGPMGDRQDMQSIRPSDYIAPNGLVPFEDGSVELTAAGRQAAAGAAKELAGQLFVVEVRGHASAAESAISDDRGMFLSYRRALAAARVLEEHGVKWRQIRVVAMGDTSRITPRAADRAGHRSNQRVEIFQTEDLMPDDPYARETPDGPPQETGRASEAGDELDGGGH
jgi:flagellar motor protein MotB